MSTQVILLERVDSLGAMGDVVSVKPGYARNFLLPQKKAMRATKANIAFFEAQRKVLEGNNSKKREEAEKQSQKMNNLKVVIIRQAAEAGQLYGSVATRDIAEAVTAAGHKVERNQVLLNQSLKSIGLFPIQIALHPEVKVQVTLNIARSEEEAKVQEKTGRALIASAQEDDRRAREEAEQAQAAKAASAAAEAEQSDTSEEEAA